MVDYDQIWRIEPADNQRIGEQRNAQQGKRQALSCQQSRVESRRWVMDLCRTCELCLRIHEQFWGGILYDDKFLYRVQVNDYRLAYIWNVFNNISKYSTCLAMFYDLIWLWIRKRHYHTYLTIILIYILFLFTKLNLYACIACFSLFSAPLCSLKNIIVLKYERQIIKSKSCLLFIIKDLK